MDAQRRPALATIVAAAIAAGGDLLLGAVCPGCGAPGLGLCAGCRRLVDHAVVRRRTPDPPPVGLPVTLSCAAYEDPFRSMITAHKEDGALLLTPVLGRLLARSVSALLELAGAVGQPVALVPMPSSAAAVRRRGFDATGSMARRAAYGLRRGGQPVRVRPMLAQRRTVRDQAGLGAAARRRNLAGGLSVRHLLRGTGEPGWLVLVDDVVTTGATLAEAAIVLRGHGWVVLGAAVVAATARRSERPRSRLSED